MKSSWLIVVAVALSCIWWLFHSGNRALQEELDHRQILSSIASLDPTFLSAAPVPIGEAIELLDYSPADHEKKEAPLIIPTSISEMARQFGELLQEDLEVLPEEDQGAAIGALLRKLSAINAAFHFYADEIKTPEGAGALIGGVLSSIVGLSDTQTQEIVDIVASTRRVANSEGLLGNEPENAEEMELWRAKRSALEHDAKQRILAAIPEGDREKSAEKIAKLPILLKMEEAAQWLGRW